MTHYDTVLLLQTCLVPAALLQDMWTLVIHFLPFSCVLVMSTSDSSLNLRQENIRSAQSSAVQDIQWETW